MTGGWARTAITYAAALSLMGCSGSDAASDPAEAADAAASPDAGTHAQPAEQLLTVTTGEYEIPSGDSFECFYTDVISDREIAVLYATGDQRGRGGHHVTAYFTDEMQPPGHHPCDDAEMIKWHQVAGAGESDADPDFALRLPDGLGIRLPEGKQLVLQSHYINTGAPFMAEAVVDLHTAEPSQLDSFVNQFVVLNSAFALAPGETTESVYTCTVPATLNVVLLLGHMHEWGVHYRLETIDDEGEPTDLLYDTAWDPSYSSHPPVSHYSKTDPLVLAAGTRLRETCRWNNVEDETLAFPREMCIAYALFFPDQGQIFCEPEE